MMDFVRKKSKFPTFSLDEVVSKSFEDQWMEAQKFRLGKKQKKEKAFESSEIWFEMKVILVWSPVLDPWPRNDWSRWHAETNS